MHILWNSPCVSFLLIGGSQCLQWDWETSLCHLLWNNQWPLWKTHFTMWARSSTSATVRGFPCTTMFGHQSQDMKYLRVSPESVKGYCMLRCLQVLVYFMLWDFCSASSIAPGINVTVFFKVLLFQLHRSWFSDARYSSHFKRCKHWRLHLL